MDAVLAAYAAGKGRNELPSPSIGSPAPEAR
jgi:hypothetical protein